MAPTAYADDAVESILVPTDGSDAATAALERALSIADASDAVVHVLAVVDVTTAPLEFDVEFVDRLERAKTGLVEDVVAAYEGHEAGVTGDVRRGRPAQVIVQYADEHDIDLIVLGRTGRDGLTKPFLGSTTRRVTRSAPVPVLVVPASSGGD